MDGEDAGVDTVGGGLRCFVLRKDVRDEDDSIPGDGGGAGDGDGGGRRTDGPGACRREVRQ